MTNSKRKKKTKKNAETTSSSSTGQSSFKTTTKYSVDQLMDKVDELMDSFDYDLAIKFYQRALTMDATSLRILETGALLKLEIGSIEEAKEHFLSAVKLSPNRGHAKFMYLAQMEDGEKSVAAFQQGIKVIEEELQSSNVPDETSDGASASPGSSSSQGCSRFKKATVRDLSSAYCSIAEIYMTDLCDAENAEVSCKEAVDKAVEVDPSNAEAWQLMASFQLVKCQPETAKEAIVKSVDLWWPKVKEVMDKTTCDVEMQDKEEDELSLEEISGLSSEARVNCAKILMELGLNDRAYDILEVTLEEDDDNFEVCYLLCHAAKKLYPNGEDPSVKLYATTTRIMAEKLGVADIVQEMNELLNNLPESDSEDVDQDEEIPSSSDEEDNAMET